jgi:rare lipoprotein A
MELELISNNAGSLSPQTKTESSSRKASEEKFSEVLKAGLEPEPTTAEPVPNKPVEYIVKPGDSLWKIAKQHFIKDPRRIAKDNGLSNPNLIRPGQRLLIYPSPSQPAQPTENGEMTASWYGPEYHNKITASGERFDMNKNTLAHKTLPMGTKVRLVNPENGRVAEGVVNDRGPFIKNRQADVSYALAKQLGFVKKGIAKLKIEII